MSHLCHIFQRHTWEMYVHMCVIYEVNSIKHVTRRTVHILHKLHSMLLAHITGQYGYCIINRGHSAFNMYWHKDLTLMHIGGKKSTATSTSHDIAIHVLETNKAQKYTHVMGICGVHICIYMPQMKSLVSILWSRTWYTYVSHYISSH